MSEDEIRSLEEAVLALPENLPLRRQLADRLLSARRFEAALAQAEAIALRAPTDGAARILASRCRFEIGRYAEALLDYEAAVALDLRLADASLRERIVQASMDPRARIRLVADGPHGDPPPVAPDSAERPAITFADVGGLDDLKEKIRLRVLYPLQRPELYSAFGKKAGGGLLFYGPPGCGKTYLARATAGEGRIHFVAVGIEDVLDMWLGQSEKKLHDLFATARAKAPAVLFFDEVDALGGRRSGLRHESYRTLVTQFLSELDGAGGRQNAGVLVMGATNAPWDVDPAFRRPGRFGDVLFVPPPDLRARVEIVKLKLVGKPQAQGREVDVLAIARKTELYSGADLEHVVDAACETALAASLASNVVRPLDTDALLAAVARVRPTTREWFASARNFAQYANQAGQYDDVLEYMKRFDLA
ncbi:MAG: AAA family ATPase [Myxococcales bacterium]|nr:AAA family ATPase [Myxococcales bacterium]